MPKTNTEDGASGNLAFQSTIAIVWLALIAYCSFRDREATQLAICLPPLFAIPLYVAWRLGSVVLTLFTGFSFVSYGIAPSFFFINRRNYSYSGDFGAVRAFGFGFGEFLRMDARVAGFLFMLLGFASIGIALNRRAIAPRATQQSDGPARRALYDYAIVVFILAIAIPQSLLMYHLRVGITGIVPPQLPFRLTGLLYYSRLLIYPLALFVAYSRCSRSPVTDAVILGYGFVAALASTSRSTLLVSTAGVVVDSLLNRRRLRFIIAAAIVLASFLITSRSRDLVYSEHLPFGAYVNQALHDRNGPAMGPGEVVGAIALRLWGPQDVVLASQYDIANRLVAVCSWFLDRPVIHLDAELYGVSFEGTGFGVGIGLIPWMIILSRRSYAILLLLAAIIAVMIVFADRAVRSLLSARGKTISALADPLAFVFVFVLYSASSMRWCYELLAIMYAIHMALTLFHPFHDQQELASV